MQLDATQPSPDLGMPPPPDRGGIELGTVGWENTLEWVEFGQGDPVDSGKTLIRVQLFRGRDKTQPLAQGIGQGHQILAQLNTLSGMRIPPKGMLVWVAFPAEMDLTPGAGVIIAGASSTAQTPQLAKDRVVLDFGDVDVVFRGRSLSLHDKENRFLCVGASRTGNGAPGILMQDETGTGIHLHGGNVEITATDNGSPNKVKTWAHLDSGGFSVTQVDGSGKTSALTIKDGKTILLTPNKVQLTTGAVLLGAAGFKPVMLATSGSMGTFLTALSTWVGAVGGALAPAINGPTTTFATAIGVFASAESESTTFMASG